MNRVDRFRQARQIRNRYLLSAVIFFTILAPGIYIVDNSVKAMIGDDSVPALVSVENYQNYIEIGVMNQKIYINTEYITRDLKHLYFIIQQCYNRRDSGVT